MFVYIWEYIVERDHRDDFVQYYSPDGVWVTLFKKSDGFVRTELLVHCDDPQRFFTIDYWRSKAARDAFRERYARDFEAIDEKCEVFTTSERLLGDFETC